MTTYFVADDLKAITFPAMNAIANHLFVFAVSLDFIIFNNGVFAVLPNRCQKLSSSLFPSMVTWAESYTLMAAGSSSEA